MVLNRSKIEKMVTVLFCLFIILSSYGFIGSTSIGEVLMFAMSLVALIFTRKFSRVSGLLWLWLYIVLQTIVLLFLSKPYATLMPTLNKLIRLSMMFFIVMVIADIIDSRLLYKIYWIISSAAIVCVIIQAVQIWILNVPMTIMIPFYEYTLKDQTMLLSSNRPSAFFLEPQHLCSFLLPLLLIEIKKQEYFKAGILSFTILLSTSTLGLICTGIVWIMFLVFDSNRKLKSKIVMSLLIVSFIVAYIYTDLFTGSISKIQSGTFDNNIRIFRALEVFAEMPFTDKITGIGMKNINNYLAYSGVCNKWLMSNLSPAHNFISSFVGNFIEFGIIGGIGYLLMTIKMFIQSSMAGKVFVVLILVSALSMTISYNVWMVFYWVMFYTINNEDKLEKMGW